MILFQHMMITIKTVKTKYNKISIINIFLFKVLFIITKLLIVRVCDSNTGNKENAVRMLIKFSVRN